MLNASPQFASVIQGAHQQLQGDLAAAQHFVDATHEYGGATMNAKTGHVFQMGENVHLVGGHPDPQSGEKIGTRYYDQGVDNPHLTVAQAHAERLRNLIVTGGGTRSTALGSWVDSGNPHKGVQIDTSTIFHNRHRGENAVLDRNEDAMLHMKDLSETRNEDIRAKRGLPARPPKTD